jgi:ribosomal protein S12 methylthiotransferase accessory factor
LQVLKNNNFETFVIDVRHRQLDIPAFYTMIPGTDFRERTASANTGMICAKIVAETFEASRAVEWLTRLDTLLPNKYYVQFYMGHIQLNQGLLDEAEGFFARAVDLRPPDEERADIYTYLGLCRKQKEQYPSALEVLQLADEIDPERTDTLNLMGFCHFKLKNHEAAVACFKRIIALNPGSAIDYANLAVNYRAMDQRSKAIANYQLALRLDPNIDFAREHLAQMGVDMADQVSNFASTSSPKAR